MNPDREKRGNRANLAIEQSPSGSSGSAKMAQGLMAVNRPSHLVSKLPVFELPPELRYGKIRFEGPGVGPVIQFCRCVKKNGVLEMGDASATIEDPDDPVGKWHAKLLAFLKERYTCTLDCYSSRSGKVLEKGLRQYLVGKSIQENPAKDPRLVFGIGRDDYLVPSVKSGSVASRDRPRRKSSERRSLEETWKVLEIEGLEMPRKKDGKPLVPRVMPKYDDKAPLGFSYFKTGLEAADLSHFTLPRSFFGRSSFEAVNFKNTNLSESRMYWNDFYGCDFSSADMSGCDMRASVFKNCKFVGAILRGADLRGSKFQKCTFAKADLTGAIADEDETIEYLLDQITAKQKRSMVWHEDTGPEPPGG